MFLSFLLRVSGAKARFSFLVLRTFLGLAYAELKVNFAEGFAVYRYVVSMPTAFLWLTPFLCLTSLRAYAVSSFMFDRLRPFESFYGSFVGFRYLVLLVLSLSKFVLIVAVNYFFFISFTVAYSPSSFSVIS